MLVLTGLGVLVWINRVVVAALITVGASWALMLAAAVLVGEGQGKTGHGWIVGCVAMLWAGYVKRGTKPR